MENLKQAVQNTKSHANTGGQPHNGKGRHFFRSLLSIGTDNIIQTPGTRSIRMANASALAGAFTHLLYGVFYIVYDARHFLPAILVILAAIPSMLSVLWLNHGKRHLLAAIVLNLTVPGYVFLNLYLFLGHSVGNHYFFILFSLLPLITFPRGQWGWRYALSGLSILCFLLTYSHTPSIDLSERLEPRILLTFHISSLLISLLTIVAVTGIYQALLQTSEERLIRSNRMLGETVHHANQLATTDLLTGLPNRRHLDACLTADLHLHRQDNAPLSIVLLDLDGFKHINDTYGHEAGDQILQDMAALMRQNLRQTDYCGRWGGEEFLVVLPETSAFAASQAAEKLRLTFHQHAHPAYGIVTASFGVAQANAGESIDALYRRADIAMYQAKADGRNRVMVAPAEK